MHQKSVSHPELSSGGGSSLSSGKLSKLLVSVGDETCNKVTRDNEELYTKILKATIFLLIYT